MTDTGSTDVVVVGGGVAGLVAARRLALGGRRVVVLEGSDRLGGQVWRHTLDGVDLDAAAESFATRGGTVAALLTELGLADDIVLPLASPAWVHGVDGTAAPLPATGVMGIPGHPLARDVIRAVGLRSALRAGWDAALPASVGADARSLGELVHRRMGRGVVDGLVAPVVRGVHSRQPDELPVETASPRLRALLAEKGSLAAAVRAVRASAPAGSQVAGIRGGVFRLIDELVASCASLGVRMETGVRVSRTSASGVDTDSGHVAGRVVLAAPDPASPPAPVRRLTLVTLVTDAPALDGAPRGTGVLVAAGAPGVTARALTHASAKWRWVAEALPGRHVVRLSYDGDPSDPVETARRDAAILLGTPLGRILDADSVPVYRPMPESGSASRTATDRTPEIGEAASGTGLAAVIARAERVARALLTGDSTPGGARSAQTSADSPSPSSGRRMEP